MRFALAAGIAVFMGFQAPVLGQESKPSEPSLESVIAYFFPGYVPIPLGDLSSEIGALTVSDAIYDHVDRSPTSVRADFDGNGLDDYALLIRKAAGSDADEIFVILMAHGEGRYSKAMESFFGGIARDIYLGYMPSGTRLPAASLTLEHPAITLNVLGQLSDVFYWDPDSSRFRTAPAPASG